MVRLPSHTTHTLQPLDRSFFKPHKSYHDNGCNSFMRKQKGERKIIKFAFGKKIKSAWLEAATCATAESVVLSTTVSFKDEVLKLNKFGKKFHPHVLRFQRKCPTSMISTVKVKLSLWLAKYHAMKT
jgi:hypothetical protein